MSNTFNQVLPIIPAAAPVYVTDIARKPHAGQFCHSLSAGAAVIYGVNKQAGRAGSDNTEYITVEGDGNTRSWDEDDFAGLADAHVATSTGLTAANALRVVVTVDDTPLIREGSDEGPADGDFCVSTGGKAIGGLAFSANPALLTTVTLTDVASGAVIFEFSDTGGVSTGADIGVDVNTGSLATTISNFVTAVNAATGINITAINDGDSSVTVIQNAVGTGGNRDVTVGSDTGSILTATNMTGGNSNKYTLTLGGAPTDGAKVEVHLATAAQVNAQTALVADQMADSEVFDFMGTATAVANVWA